MEPVTEVWVHRSNLPQTRIVQSKSSVLAPGQIRVRVDKMGLTANNVSYALSGEMIGYWGYFPAEGPWGKVPTWAMADVVESQHDGVAVGERLYGFFPMASEVVLSPGKVVPDSFLDTAPHRQSLPAFYNYYRRVKGETEALSALEDERCLLFPLFFTSFGIYDFHLDNALFGARQSMAQK